MPTVFLRPWKTEFELPVSFSAFLRSGKTEFELPISFSVYPRHRKTEFEISFSFSVFLLHWKWNSSFCFRFWFSYDFGQQNCNSHFRFSSFVCARYWKTEIDLRFRFSFLRFHHFRIWSEPEEWRHFLSVTVKRAGNQGWYFGGKKKQDGCLRKYPWWSLCSPFSYGGK